MDIEIRPTGRRTGATWMAATGAFLLLAAAAVFVAVRWGTLPDGAKAAIVGGLTGAFLLAGRALRRNLPATGDVLFHLGSFLVPVDLAGANLRLGMGWRAHLLAQGLVCTASFGALAAVSRSVVLEWAAAAAAVVVATAVGANTPVPAPLALAMGAVALTLVLPRARAALAWAALAGLAPVISVATQSLTGGRGVLTELGFLGHRQLLASVITGALAAFVLGRAAHARRDLPLAFVAVLSAMAGLATSWLAAGPSGDTDVVGLAGAFLVVELVALFARRDPFWQRPAAIIGGVCEGLAAMAAYAGTLALAIVIAMGDIEGTHTTLAVGAALLAAGWFTADLRRREEDGTGFGLALLMGGGSPLTTAPLAVCAVGAVVAGSGSLVAGATAMVAVAGLLVLSGRALGHATAAALTLSAPLLARDNAVAVVMLGVAGAAVLAAAARVRSDMRDARDAVLAVLATAVVLETAFVFGVVNYRHAEAVTGAIVACWLLALALDHGRAPVGDTDLGNIARVGAVLPLVAATPLPASEALVAAVIFTALVIAEAVRLDDPRTGVVAACSVQLVVVEVARLSELETPAVGLALCVVAAVWAGLAGVVPKRWRLSFVAASGLGVGAGLVTSAGDPQYFGDAVIVAGAITVAVAVATRVDATAHVGGALITIGTWTHLTTAGVQLTEAYVLPVSLHLMLAGARVRQRRPLSSWVAYGPAIGLLGVAALDERLAGGGAWHALVAGAVGVAAVAAGGWRRLSGPLVLGTALVVAVTMHETLGAVATVPTWVWLAAGGTLLLGLGVQLERTDSSPVEAGRRMVDVMSERFE